MLRPLKSSKTPRLSKEAKNLIEWCISLDQSGSRLEDTFWELKVNHAINKLLTTGNEKPLETALEYLSEHHPGGFEALIEQAENLSSMCLVEVDGQHWQALLVSAPVVCWTRYQIPNHTVGPAQSDTLLLALKDVVLAENTSLAMVPKLISLDQMPQSFAETLTWTKQLAQLAITQSGPLPTLNAEPEHTGILADSRHLVMVVVAPVGEPIFKWQEKVNNRRDKCGPKWSKAVHTSLASLLAGCEFESLLPDAYYLNLRESDKFVRPLTIKASVAWLCSAMSKTPLQFRAVIASFGEERIEEYRISFTEKGQNNVLYGIVWPVFLHEEFSNLNDEENKIDTVEKIVAVLFESGVTDVRRLPGLMASEFCEDCGAPQFANPMGELVHAELPDDIQDTAVRFH